MTKRRALALVVAFAALPGVAPGHGHAQTGASVRNASQGTAVVAQSIAVPVYPGQMIAATVIIPMFEETPLPAVLMLTVRHPGAAPVQAGRALTEALLARGIAVVQMELVPAVEALAGEPLDQPADDAYAVLQFVREREDIDGDRVALVGVGAAAEHAALAATLDEGVRALVLLGAEPASADTMDLPTGFPLMALPLDARVVPDGAATPTPAVDAAAFLARHLQ